MPAPTAMNQGNQGVTMYKYSEESNRAVAEELGILEELMAKWKEENLSEWEQLERLKNYVQQTTDAAKARCL